MILKKSCTRPINKLFYQKIEHLVGQFLIIENQLFFIDLMIRVLSNQIKFKFI